MSYGLINTGQSVKQQAMAGLKQTAQEEQNRNMANRQIEQAQRSEKKGLASAGATMGAMVGTNMAASAAAGTAAAGSATAAIGGLGTMGAAAATGGIGLLAGLVLSELF